MLRLLDTLAHRLSWVISHALYRFICDRYEARLLAPAVDPVDYDFDEPDEPVEDVVAAFRQGIQKGSTGRPVVGYRCQHAGIVVGAGVTLSDASSWCGCQMEPVYAA